MKRLLFKCLMVVAVLGMVLSFQGVGSAAAFTNCDIDDILQMDQNTIRVKFDAGSCDSTEDTLLFRVRRGTTVIYFSGFSSQANNQFTYLNLPENIAGNVSYSVQMFRLVGISWDWVDTDWFTGGI